MNEQDIGHIAGLPITVEAEGIASMNTAEILIRPFEVKDARAFRQLNEEWIALHFGIEEHDSVQLGDPEGHILRPGGQIFIAVAGDEPIGCCALVKGSDGVFELAKMAVTQRYRGRGLGRKLLVHSIARAKAMGAKTLYLESSVELADAVHLYESVGFRHLPPEKIQPSPYARATVFMEMDLSASASPASDRQALLQPA
jgi:putative acetyltransferase